MIYSFSGGFAVGAHSRSVFVFSGDFDISGSIVIDPGTPSGEDLNLAIQRMAIEYF